MKNLLIIAFLILGTITANAQRMGRNNELVVTIGMTGGQAANAYLGIGLKGFIGGEISIGAAVGQEENAGYVGGLITYDLLSARPKNRWMRKNDFNVKLGVGAETKQQYTRPDDLPNRLYQQVYAKEIESNVAAPMAKVSVRFKAINLSVGYSGVSGASFGFGLNLKR